MNTFNLSPAKRKHVFNIYCHFSIMCQLFMNLEFHFFGIQSHILIPIPSLFLPVLIPLFFGSGLHEILHLHLLKFTCPVKEILSVNLISESFSDLCYTEWKFLP